MKVAVVIERYDVSLGGAEWLAYEMVSALCGLGIDTHVLTARASEPADNVHVLCPQMRGKRVSLRLFSDIVRRHLTQHCFDVVHSLVPMPFADVYQPPGGSFIETAIRNAASYQNRLLSAYKKATARLNWRRAESLRAERQLCADANGPVVAALSQYVRQQFKNHYALADERMAVIPNGVRTDKPPNGSRIKMLKTAVLEQLRISDRDRPVFFLFAANNFRLKGLTPLIRALAMAQTSGTAEHAYLIIVGSDRPGGYRRLAHRLGVADKAAFLGFVNDMENMLAISDVAVLPTFYDPASRFILEALAAGKPVITTKFNGAADLFVNDRHGKVMDSPENTEALAQAIAHFTHADNIRTAAQAIRNDNLKHKVSIDRLAAQLVALYESVLQKKSRHQCTQSICLQS